MKNFCSSTWVKVGIAFTEEQNFKYTKCKLFYQNEIIDEVET
jgi:hypothetical protein